MKLPVGQWDPLDRPITILISPGNVVFILAVHRIITISLIIAQGKCFKIQDTYRYKSTLHSILR